MVREQEPPRVPFSPAKMNIPSEPKPQKHTQHNPLSALARPNSSQPRSAVAEQPQFGKATTLGLSPQAAPKPRVNDNNAPSQKPRVASGGTSDKYSNLFISSKTTNPRPEHFKPPQSTNPLLQAHNQSRVQARPLAPHNPVQAPTYSSQASDARPTTLSRPVDDGYAIEVPRTTITRPWVPPPTAPPRFSSNNMTNPYFNVQNFIDLTTASVGMSTNAGLYDDKFGAADPYTYVDSTTANENIKALLEGAFEDEEDKPRTRRRLKQIQDKADELVDKLKDMKVDVKQDDEDEEDTEEDDGTVEGLKVKLLPHQIEGVAWMRDKETGTKKMRGLLPKGGILADDMGLGKTIQSIALLLTNPKPSFESVKPLAGSKDKPNPLANVDKGTLVVAPLALIKQWEGEIQNRVEKSHTLKVCVHHGPQRTKSFKDLKKYDVVITTYHTLVSEHNSSGGTLKVGCFGLKWYRVILDEAHSIKNRNAKAAKAACALDAVYRWCLTGTPMQNNLDELQSLIHFLRIKPFDDLNAWREQITRPMTNGRGGLAIKRLQVYLKAFMKRRTKDILKQDGALKSGDGARTEIGNGNAFKIVERTVEKIEADFTPEERAFYTRLETRTDKSLEQMMAGNKVSYASALVLLLRLRQACNHPQLVKGDLAKERDAFTNGSGSQTPSRKKAGADEMDSIADMLGGLSVATKRCDVCQSELSAKLSSAGAIRCEDCEADLESDVLKRKVKKHGKKTRREKQKPLRKQHSKTRRIVDDSDEEDDDEDEDIQPTRRKATGVVNLITDDEESSEASSEVDDSDEDDEDGSSSEEDADDNLMRSTKIRHLLSILKADAKEHKYIVFSFFTSMLDLIEPFLKRDGLVYTRYDGQMRNDMREASLERLRTHSKTRILLCSLRAGSLGLNLTAASRVVILEPFWNPFVEEQAIDRVHRLNQTEDVIVYKMTVQDTVEARILDLQERKRELANATIEGKTAAGKLTLQDMLKLFRHDAEHTHGVDGIGMGKTKLLRDGTEADGDLTMTRGSREGSGGPSQPARRKEHEVYGRRW